MALTKKRAAACEPPGPDDPEVLLDVVYDRGCLFLVLANDGAATAFDVRVSFAKPLLGAGGAIDLAQLALFRALPLLRAGQEIRVFLDVASDLLGRKGARQVRAHVTYRSRARKRLGEVFNHDLRMWRDWPQARIGGKDV